MDSFGTVEPHYNEVLVISGFSLYQGRKTNPAFRLGPVYWGNSRFSPGNTIVWTLAGTSPGGPTKHVGSGDKMLRGERPWAHN